MTAEARILIRQADREKSATLRLIAPAKGNPERQDCRVAALLAMTNLSADLDGREVKTRRGELCETKPICAGPDQRQVICENRVMREMASRRAVQNKANFRGSQERELRWSKCRRTRRRGWS